MDKSPASQKDRSIELISGWNRMMVAVLDTTVILHLFRQDPPALAWFNN